MPTLSERFHAGELAVQQRAGVAEEAARLVGMLAAPVLDGGPRRFLAARTFAVVAARDADGALWSAPLSGPPGFLDAAHTRLTVHTTPRAGDPLAGLPAGQRLGLLAIDLAARRRMRVNGTLVHAGDRLEIEVDQAYGNCPKYIHARPDAPAPAGDAHRVRTSELNGGHVRLIRAADTFFLGTSHPTRGNDSSHRGGPAGFVRVENGMLWWPDYPGNNMFNSFGNLAVDPSASLLFLDFRTGAALQLSGRAELDWSEPTMRADDITGRRVRFVPSHIVRTG
jgi:predicted pyridoxine 5'-phosphate oxidase superfamily flavin-nucleotide-binding protein